MCEPTKQEVVDAIMQGIISAQEDYKKADDSDIISEYCPEYYITVYIFQSLLKLKNKYKQGFQLSVEESVFKMRNKLGIRGRAPDITPPQGKCDLALKDQSDSPHVVIEVKKDPFDYQENVGRLSYLVSCGLECGVFASCLFVEVEDKNFQEAQDKLERFTEDIHNYIQSFNRKWKYDLLVEKQIGEIQDFPEESKIYKWCPICFVIGKKRTSYTHPS